MAEHEQQELDLGLSQAEKDRSELETLRRVNGEKMGVIASKRMRPDPAGLLMLRINTLIDMLDEDQRLAFELAFERAMVDVLDSCLEQAAHIELTQGIPPIAANGPVAGPSDARKMRGGLILPGN